MLVALGFVAAGVRIGDGAVPVGDRRQPVPATAALGRPAAQISAESSRSDGGAVGLAAAIDEFSLSRSNTRLAADSPAAPGALPAPLRSPQPALAPGTSPPTASPPGGGPSPLDPPPAAGAVGEILEGLVQPAVDLITPVTDPITDPVTDQLTPTVDPVLEVFEL